MNESKIAVRYAKAFFELAKEKNLVEKLRSDIDLVAGMCAQSEFLLLVESPVIKTSRKLAIFNELLAKKMNKLSLNFMLMVVENKREIHLPAICRNFIDRYRAMKGVKSAKITTTEALDEKLEEKIKASIKKLFNTEVELICEENKELIGGFVLRVGDQQIDASVANKLKRIEREFLNTTL